MSISIKLPDNKDMILEEGKPVVIIGANGSGKTRFGVRLEEVNDNSYGHGYTENKLLIHRISAQKSLTINDSITVHDFDSALNELFIGSNNKSAVKFHYRYSGNPATGLLSDYNQALSLLFAEENAQLQKAHNDDIAAIESGKDRPAPITTVVEVASSIWNELLPQRQIDLSGNNVHVVMDGSRYHGKEMSDGERVILYMICQVLVLKQHSVIIIDEPELHIHRAIVNSLWSKLEEVRSDCVFMYITHDIDFALTRATDQIIWIKRYDGTNWEYEQLNISEYSELPHNLLLELLGTRQKVLFVEGADDSYDRYIYQEFYQSKGYHIIPCGGCQDVIKYVKAKQAYETLNSVEVYGLIDRDYRVQQELSALKREGIYSIDVAEVENLFLVPGILEIMSAQLGCEEGTAQKAQDKIREIYEQNRENQIGEAFIREINHQLTLKTFSGKHLLPSEIKASLDVDFSEEILNGYYNEKRLIFEAAYSVDEILKVFNFKPLGRIISTVFGLSYSDFAQRVLNIIRINPPIRKAILATLSHYLPELP